MSKTKAWFIVEAGHNYRGQLLQDFFQSQGVFEINEIKLVATANTLKFITDLRSRGITQPVVLFSTPYNKSITNADLLNFKNLGVRHFLRNIRNPLIFLRAVQSALSDPEGSFLYTEENVSDDTLKHLFPVPVNGKQSKEVFCEFASIEDDKNPNEPQTICVSPQIGCEIGCLHCATGCEANRHVRNSSFPEMRYQVDAAVKMHGFQFKKKHIAIQGEGEGTFNLPNIKKLADSLGDDYTFRLSTVGIIPQLKEFIRMFGKDPRWTRLQLSVLFWINEERAKHNRVAKNNPLEILLNLCEDYANISGNLVCLNYPLFWRLNTADRMVERGIELVKGRPFFIRLSQANPYGIYLPETVERTRKIADMLEDAGIKSTAFVSRGPGTSGCGQLSGKVNR